MIGVMTLGSKEKPYPLEDPRRRRQSRLGMNDYEASIVMILIQKEKDEGVSRRASVLNWQNPPKVRDDPVVMPFIVKRKPLPLPPIPPQPPKRP
jgi:hypothetical protein